MSTAPLDAVAARATTEPFFLGYHLSQAAERHGWTGADLARELGCTVEALTMLRLCRAPREGRVYCPDPAAAIITSAASVVVTTSPPADLTIWSAASFASLFDALVDNAKYT